MVQQRDDVTASASIVIGRSVSRCSVALQLHRDHWLLPEGSSKGQSSSDGPIHRGHHEGRPVPWSSCKARPFTVRICRMTHAAGVLIAKDLSVVWLRASVITRRRAAVKTHTKELPSDRRAATGITLAFIHGADGYRLAFPGDYDT